MLYDDIRRAFLADLKHSLSLFSVTIEKESGAWWAVRCPMPNCADTSGSAGIDTSSGYLRCHQCGAAHELFTWLGALLPNPTTWDLCLALADMFRIERPKKKRKGGAPKEGLTDAYLAECEALLWGSSNQFKTHLQERGFTQAELVSFRLALCDRGLLFAGWDEHGHLLDRGHCWGGPRAHPRWLWWPNRRGSATPLSIWPAWIPPLDESQEIWLFEGEWDVLIARCKFGLAAYTWTGGASAVIHESRTPSYFRGRKVNICYDLDVFAGPGMPVPTSGLQAQRNLLMKSAPMLESKFKCRVTIRKVPLDQTKHPKGDIRDWWNETQGKDGMAAFEAWSLSEAWKVPVEPTVETEIGKIGIVDGQRVGLLATASAVADEAMLVHNLLTVECSMGTSAACNSCRLYHEYPDGVVKVKEEGLFGALYATSDLQRNMEDYLHPGRGCPGLSVKEIYEPNPEASRQAYHWWLCPPLDDDSPAVFAAMSWQRPTIATNLQVTGKLVAHPRAKVIAVVDKLEEPRSTPFDCSKFADEMRNITPWHEDNAELTWRYLNHRQEDLQANVTKIFGVDWALAFEILVHSALELPNGERGWIDGAFCGFTRSGKTETVRTLCGHYGLPPNYVTSVQGNVSRSGLTTTVEKIQGSEHKQWRARPGLFPRRDTRLVCLDEFHHMVPQGQRKNDLINELQSVRDRGFLDVEKAAHARFRSRVRLLTISNPPRRNGFNSYRYPCMVVRDLYGTDEAISRLDWMFMSTADESEIAPRHTCKQVWSPRLCTILRQRAWSMKPEQIHFAEGVEESARSIGEEWQTRYVSSLPLYTRREKWRSVLRVATAIALLRFSHTDDPNHCVVRLSDVQVARDWFEMTFESSGFDLYSLNELQRPLADVLGIEACLLVKVFQDTDRAKLIHLFGPLHRSTIAERLGFAIGDDPSVENWMSTMISLGGLEDTPGEAGNTYSLTPAAKDVISAIHRQPFSHGRRDVLRNIYFRKPGEFAPETPKPLAGLERWT